MSKQVIYSRQDIIKTGVNLVDYYGKDFLTARNIASKLECSVKPLFSNFENMEQIKMEVYIEANKLYQSYIKRGFDYFPQFKQVGIETVRFVHEHHNLYLFLIEESNNNEIFGKIFNNGFGDNDEQIALLISKQQGIDVDDAMKVMTHLSLHVLGLAQTMVQNQRDFDEEKISNFLGEAFYGFVQVYKNKKSDSFKELPKLIKEDNKND